MDVLDFLSQSNIKDDDLVLFFDAKDVFFLTDINRIASQFIKLNVSILFSAEFNCWPCYQSDVPLWNPVPPYHPRFINSGLYIAYAKPMKNLLTDILEELNRKSNFTFPDFEDQGWIHIFYHKHIYPISIDSNITIFQSMLFQDLDNLIHYKDHKIWNSKTRTSIKVMHFNGSNSSSEMVLLAQKFLRYVTIDDSILEKNYHNATFTAWFKGYAPVSVKIKELCDDNTIVTTKFLHNEI